MEADYFGQTFASARGGFACWAGFIPEELRAHAGWHAPVPELKPGARALLGLHLTAGVAWPWAIVKVCGGRRVGVQLLDYPSDCGLVEGEMVGIDPEEHAHFVLIDAAAEEALQAWRAARRQARAGLSGSASA
jgi:hypothetical protein